MIAVILLAAGQSSRMGFPKGLLKWKGIPLIAYQIQQLQHASIDQLVVVLGYRSDVYHPIISVDGPTDRVVYNEEWSDGKSTSILKGLTSLHESVKAILFINVDQPVSLSVIQTLLHAFLKIGKGIYIPVYESKRGHPILISSEFKEDLLTIKEETRGLKKVVQDNSRHVHHIGVNEPSIFYNFNSLQDYQGRG